MAVTITQKRRQKYLLLISAVVIAALAIIWLGMLRGDETSEPEAKPVIYAPPEVKINWQILDEIGEEILAPFEQISPFEGEFGRENPFIPY